MEVENNGKMSLQNYYPSSKEIIESIFETDFELAKQILICK